MAAVLGIDAAWTQQHPSGVALLQQKGTQWCCVAIAPSYKSFLALANGQPIDWKERHRGDCPAPEALVAASRRLLGGSDLCVIACDIPLALTTLRSRRPADNEVSCRYGAVGCSTHSPSVDRPGMLSELLRNGFTQAGFHLITAGYAKGNRDALIEVFPHVALLELCDRTFRIPYKVQKSARYWPGKSVTERIVLLRNEMALILASLRKTISDINLRLPDANDCSCLSELKKYEDVIDALVCAWVGIELIGGRACALGDAEAAIWVPQISTRHRTANDS